VLTSGSKSGLACLDSKDVSARASHHATYFATGHTALPGNDTATPYDTEKVEMAACLWLGQRCCFATTTAVARGHGPRILSHSPDRLAHLPTGINRPCMPIRIG